MNILFLPELFKTIFDKTRLIAMRSQPNCFEVVVVVVILNVDVVV